MHVSASGISATKHSLCGIDTRHWSVGAQASIAPDQDRHCTCECIELLSRLRVVCCIADVDVACNTWSSNSFHITGKIRLWRPRAVYRYRPAVGEAFGPVLYSTSARAQRGIFKFRVMAMRCLASLHGVRVDNIPKGILERNSKEFVPQCH